MILPPRAACFFCLMTPCFATADVLRIIFWENIGLEESGEPLLVHADQATVESAAM